MRRHRRLGLEGYQYASDRNSFEARELGQGPLLLVCQSKIIVERQIRKALVSGTPLGAWPANHEIEIFCLSLGEVGHSVIDAEAHQAAGHMFFEQSTMLKQIE